MRCFLALLLPEPEAQVLGGVASWLSSTLGEDRTRPVPAERLHVTLAFLGERTDQERARAAAALEVAFADEAAYQLEADRLERFAHGGVLAVHVGGNDLERLHAARERMMVPLVEHGLVQGEFPVWRPHATLVRSRRREQLSIPAGPPPGLPVPFVGAEVALVVSTQARGERRYAPAVTIPLGR